MVSEIAAACPSCAYPVAQTKFTNSPSQPITTIEQTGKKYKMMQLISILIMIAGVISCSANQKPHNFQSGQTSMLLVFGGFFGFIFSRIAAWWHHG